MSCYFLDFISLLKDGRLAYLKSLYICRIYIYFSTMRSVQTLSNGTIITVS